jgi:HEAT repeat protein
MYKNPDLPSPDHELLFPTEAIPLWVKALDAPEVETRLQAATAIARARRLGFKGFETTIAPLRAALDRADQHPAVRLAIAQALLSLDARDTAPSLWQQAQSGDSDLNDLVEPALARWDYRPARAAWLERLRAAGTSHHYLILAIQGLAAVREEQAADRLRDLALAEQNPGPVRLEAARALALLRKDGLEKDAENLAGNTSSGGLVDRLAAAMLLQQHRSEAAVRLLQALAGDNEPAVVGLAAGRLVQIDPGFAVPLVDRFVASDDAKVRALGVEVLFRQPNEHHVHLLMDRLDDPHSGVRVQARKALHDLAGRKEFRDQVIAEGTRVLAGEDWRGQEQATILLTQLDHKAIGRRLLELLHSTRPEVLVTAAWGLRKLAVRETLPEVVKYIEGELKSSNRTSLPGSIMHHQLSQLNQFLGQEKFSPADALLRRFIPKRTDALVGPESRAAAICALGWIHEGKPDSALVTVLLERINDIRSIPPEAEQVRWMCAIAFGRMKAQSALDDLRTFSGREMSENPVVNACGWAIQQLTGEPLPPPRTIRKVRRDWFFVPNPGPME